MKLKSGMIVHCDTREKAGIFLKECHKEGWKWHSGKALIDDSGVNTQYNAFYESTVYYLDNKTIQYGKTIGLSNGKVISFDDLLKTTEKKRCNTYTKHEYIHDNVEKLIINEPCVIVILETGEKGVSKCHPEDVFNEELGYKIAYQRAKIKEMKANLKFQETRLKYLIEYSY